MSATFVPENKMSEVSPTKSDPLKENTEVIVDAKIDAKNSEPVAATGKGSIMQRAIERHKSLRPENEEIKGQTEVKVPGNSITDEEFQRAWEISQESAKEAKASESLRRNTE